MDKNLLVEAARKHIENVQFIIDLFDLTFSWVDEKTTKKYGYTASDMIDRQIFDFSFFDKKSSRRLMKTFLERNEIREIPLKTKDGKKIMKKVKYKIFRYKLTPYMAAIFY